MKKIVWIASYPKSGNTWMRYLLGNYFFNHNYKFDPNIISYLKKFHLDDKLLNLNRLQDLKENPYNASKYWIKSQEDLKILNGDIAFLKTHNALININGNEFTNDDLTDYGMYQVKLVMSTTDTTKVVRVKNLKFIPNKIDNSLKPMQVASVQINKFIH